MSFIFDGRPAESPLIETLWKTETHTEGAFISSASVQSEMVIVKYEGKTSLFIRGPETQASPADFPPGVEFFGIRLKLGTYMPTLPALNLIDRNDAVLPEASGKSFWLHGSAWEFPTFENADTFIARLIRQGLLIHDPIVSAAVQGQSPDLSIRAVQYRILRATGLTQKTIQQIERAQQAAALLQGGTSILDTVFEAGYFDQAHLTRSLKRFMGQTPSQILRLNERA